MNPTIDQPEQLDQLLNQQQLNEVESEVLRAQIRVKSIVTLTSLIGMAFVSLAIGLFLSDSIPLLNIFLWCGPVLLAVLARYKIANDVIRNSENWNTTELISADKKLYVSSFASQTLVGSGMWSVALYGSSTTGLFITAIVGFYCLGAMTNLSSDFKTFSRTMPFLLGQPLLFWLLQGGEGFVYVAPLGILMLLSLRIVYFSSQSFRESILIRFEKNLLLNQLETAQHQTDIALKGAQTANKMKDFFMAAAGHDLRQPLLVIGLLNETMMMRNNDDTDKELLRKQRTAIASLGHLFDSLLDLSQFEQGTIHAYPVEFNIEHLRDSLVEEFRLACEEKGLNFDCEPMDQMVYADFALTARLLRNLFSNAVRYTSKGGIIIAGITTKTGFEISIHDTGIGIPVEKQTVIFEEFVQLEKGNNASETGVGMGLAIVKQITRLLDLKFELQSEPGKGTTVKFTLPTSVRV